MNLRNNLDTIESFCLYRDFTRKTNVKRVMLTIEGLLVVLGSGLTAFGLGYTIGYNSKKH